MKGLRKYIAPFAPDQSGAAAVLCELSGMVIILDAGGCAGNICGFDEPRWFGSKSAIFSAGLRDMDAILGRDDRLVEKVERACRKLSCTFIAVIGTPVPSVIGTDYRALQRMIEKKTGIPVMTVDTNGMELYDAGVRKALKAVFQAFAREVKGSPVCGSVGILGATPLDVTVLPGSWDIPPVWGLASDRADYGRWLRRFYQSKGYQEVYCYGMGSGIGAIQKAWKAEKNIVISPSALPSAKYLEQTFGIPFETGYPLETLPDWENISQRISELEGKKILIVHQQMLANALRDRILQEVNADITVSSWFDLDKKYCHKGDIRIKEEDQWIHLIYDGKFDIIFGDPLFCAAVPEFKGEWIAIDHFAVSGKR